MQLKQFKSGQREQIDWPVIEGDDWVLRWQMKRKNGEGVMEPIPDFTGYAFHGAVRHGETEIPIAFKTDEGNGWVTAYVRRNATVGLPSELPYEIKWLVPTELFDGGRLRTLYGGRVLIQARTATGPTYAPEETP